MTLTSLGVYLWRAITVTIAVSTADGDEAKLLTAYAETLRQRRFDLRVRILRVDSLRQTAEALQSHRADLAVVRPDVLLPIDGLTVAVLHEDAAIFLCPTGANLSDISDLAQRRLGIIVQHEADVASIAALLGHYDLTPPRVTLVPLLLGDASAALWARRVDAVALFAAPSGTVVSALVKSLTKPADRKIALLAISEATAIAEETPRFSEVEIPAGELRGARNQPPVDLKTVGVSYRLMARPELDRATVALIAQTLFQMRSRLARVTPLANRMQAIDPDSAIGAALPYHPGAIDYFAREQKTFMERYADWVYVLMFAGGGIGSPIAWIRQRMVKNRRELVDQLLDRLLTLLANARTAGSNAQLDAIAAEVDALVTSTIQKGRKRISGARTMRAVTLAVDSTRAAVLDRRISVNAALLAGRSP